ncbi:2TM domain-containing protein [Chitinophaga rhizophila]|uniref:2TM domain-containing protein n=1 Tax=Chitinophaga rhizophila TaxID=2866212 RepID=A0ABS7GFL3_9BACT|nr:2TM domain-containing protein [Chitinophaga rhizophila]MBW8686471.1 2TM domain-containing protein [Chitinophaga rhizophila]
METTSQRDERLWKIAKARASFRTSLLVYLVINAFLWALWFITQGPSHHGIPWPIWPSLGWALGLAFQYFYAWHHDPFGDAVREYEKLQAEKQRRGL